MPPPALEELRFSPGYHRTAHVSQDGTTTTTQTREETTPNASLSSTPTEVRAGLPPRRSIRPQSERSNPNDEEKQRRPPNLTAGHDGCGAHGRGIHAASVQQPPFRGRRPGCLTARMPEHGGRRGHLLPPRRSLRHQASARASAPPPGAASPQLWEHVAGKRRRRCPLPLHATTSPRDSQATGTGSFTRCSKSQSRPARTQIAAPLSTAASAKQESRAPPLIATRRVGWCPKQRRRCSKQQCSLVNEPRFIEPVGL